MYDKIITNRDQIRDIFLEQCLLSDPVEVHLIEKPGLLVSSFIDLLPDLRSEILTEDQFRNDSFDSYDPFFYLRQETFLLLAPPVCSPEVGELELKVNSPIKIRFFSGRNALHAEVSFLQYVKVQNELGLMVSYPKELGAMHARRNFRTKVRAHSKIILQINYDAFPETTVVPLDIGEGGLSFSFSHPLQLQPGPNSIKIVLRVFEEKELSLVGIIRDCTLLKSETVAGQSDEYRCGIQFVNITQAQHKGIREFISVAHQEYVLAEKKNLLCFTRELESQVREQTSLLRAKDLQILEMDRMVGMATLTAGMAHEINTPLGIIKSSVSNVTTTIFAFMDAVERQFDGLGEEGDDRHNAFGQDRMATMTESLRNKFGRILRGVDRIDTIIQDLKQFSNVDCAEISTIDLNGCLNESFAILNWSHDKKIEIKKHFRQIPAITCFPGLLKQSLLQVLRNAVDAVEMVGMVTVSTAYDCGKDEVTIQVEDNGRGMTAEVLRMAFNPFFTTKPVGSGTGMGLALVETTIKRHGGRIFLASQEGIGTTVNIILPTRGDAVK